MTDDTTAQTVHTTAERYRNWGRWGEKDQVGTLNFIEPDDVPARKADTWHVTGEPSGPGLKIDRPRGAEPQP